MAPRCWESRNRTAPSDSRTICAQRGRRAAKSRGRRAACRKRPGSRLVPRSYSAVSSSCLGWCWSNKSLLQAAKTAAHYLPGPDQGCAERVFTCTEGADVRNICAREPALEVIDPGICIRVDPTQVIETSVSLLEPLKHRPLQKVRRFDF